MPGLDSETMQAVDPTVITPGCDFGPRYRIEAVLGQGGMGRVYRAYDKDLDRVVALKVVRPGMVGEPDALRRFKQELLLASKISHKNILRIHDMGEVDGKKFITMAYVEGQDLQHIIRETPRLPLNRVFGLAQQLAEALAAAHSEGVLHRDLKPQNVLVGKNDQVFISDFGLAKSVDDGGSGMTKTGAFLGTPRYMSPEQVEGKPADLRSDLYAYGLILYEMVTGDVPFKGESTLKVMYQRVQEKPQNPKALNPHLPNWFVRIIMRCLEKDPNDRYQNAYEILADLQGAKSGSSVSTRTVQIQIPRFATEHRWVWVLAGVLAVLALLMAIPPVRHLVTGREGQGGPATVSGIPPLSSGRYVAVLPLRILGDPSQLGYIAQGIQDALSAKFFQLKDVHVSGSEATSKADQSVPLEKIARSVGANMLITGNIQGSGDKIRVVLNLENIQEKRRDWSREFDGVTGDLFTLEDQMYSQLVSALRLNLSNEELASAVERPTDNVASYDLYLRGRNSLRLNDQKSVHAALDYFDQALKDDPKFALAYTGVAQASLRMYGMTKDGFWTQKALAAAQQAQELNDKLPEVHSTLGSVYRANGKYAEAIAELKRAETLTPNSDEVYHRLGSVYLTSGDLPHAIESFQKAVDLNPYYWINENSLGAAYFQDGEYAKALEAFQRVSILEPDVNAGFENSGNVLVQEGRYSEAIPYLQKALQIEPNSDAYTNIGTAYFFLKRYSEASGAFEKAVALNPNDTQMIVNLGDSYRAMGQTEKAQAAYQRAISAGFKELQTNPQDASVLAQIALSYAKMGNSQDAETFIRRARAQDNKDVDIVYSDAKIHALNGDSGDAMRLLTEALEKHFPADFAAVDPDLDNLHSNPEFANLIKKYSPNKP
jgi:eukaryotic-like serine/threonine-protein kinase